MASANAHPVAALRAERCIIYCMTCGRSTSAATYVIEGLFGWLPYGRITNRLHCKKGCGDRFGTVLPVDAPTPRQFVERYNLAPQAKPIQQTTDTELEIDCRFRLIEVGKSGSFLKVHGKSEDPAIVEWGFDYLLRKFAKNQWGGLPHLVVAHGAQWSRDSKRDFKVVGGKVVEMLDDRDEEDPELP